uniref:G_PROTEIN_RECEP_F1_2 domain-containing protein n=1 Tax=Angiostrongylus cantonensis TaxID=6313 RepID=A0A0K0DHA7_ANGCA
MTIQFVNGTCPEMYKPLMTGGMNAFYMYVFPIQFFLGVIGNALNLCVLLSRHMQSEANYLLSALAIADILLFLTLIPEALGVWRIFYTNDLFRRFYYRSHTMRHWFSNVFSCMASWLILAVSVERYMGISSPMHTRCEWRESRVRYLVLFIVMGSLMLTAFHHFEYKYGYTTMCNGTLTYAKLVHLEKVRHLFPSTLKLYGTFLKVSQIALVVVLPLVGVVVLNLKIIVVLRRSSVLVTRSTRISSDNHNDEFLRDTDSRQRRDRKVTITVLAIITCFFLTHVLNRIRSMQDFFKGFAKTHVMNFVLFCMSSAFFRRRLLIIIRSRVSIAKMFQ